MKNRPYKPVERVKNKVDFYQLEHMVDYFLSLKFFKPRKRTMMKKEHFERLKQILEYVKNTEYLWRKL